MRASRFACLLALAAGLATGFWSNIEDLRQNWQIAKTWTPAMDEATALQVRELVTKSDGRMAVFDHRRRTGCVRDARSPRVDVTGEPSPKPYGIDFGIRDPFGHAIRIGQMLKGVIR